MDTVTSRVLLYFAIAEGKYHFLLTSITEAQIQWCTYVINLLNKLGIQDIFTQFSLMFLQTFSFEIYTFTLAFPS